MVTAPTVRIVGWGGSLPSNRLTNSDLWAMPAIRKAFDTEKARLALHDHPDVASLSPEEVFDRWALQLCGIYERRILDRSGSQTTEDLCAEACTRALDQAGMQAHDIDHLIVACLTPSETVPNAACTVADLIGNPRISGYTLNAACAGFTYGLAAAFAAVRSGVSHNVLVVAGEAMSRIADYQDPKSAILFGDGAGAVVVSSGDEGLEVVGTPALGSLYNRDALWLAGQNWQDEGDAPPKLRMRGGPSILRRAVSYMVEMASRTLTSAGLGWDDVDVVIPHQANERITQALERKVALSTGRVVNNIGRLGNLSAATVPVALDETLRGEHGPVPIPGVTVLTAVGGGYSTAAVALKAEGRGSASM